MPNSPTRLSNGDDLETIVRPQEGLISRRIFADPEVHGLELERIFAKAWFFIGHESEIPNKGDIVTRQCGVDPVIFLRDDAGVVRAFLNSCRHRGMRICRTDRDNASSLRCPYHGWSYSTSGALLAASSEHHYGEGELDKSELGLIPVTKTGSYRGLVFGTFSDTRFDFNLQLQINYSNYLKTIEPLMFSLRLPTPHSDNRRIFVPAKKIN